LNDGLILKSIDKSNAATIKNLTASGSAVTITASNGVGMGIIPTRGSLEVSGNDNLGEIDLWDSGDDYYAAIRSSSVLAGHVVLTLPDDYGTDGQVLATRGNLSGDTYWTAQTGGGGDVLLASTQTFTGNNTFNNDVSVLTDLMAGDCAALGVTSFGPLDVCDTGNAPVVNVWGNSSIAADALMTRYVDKVTLKSAYVGMDTNIADGGFYYDSVYGDMLFVPGTTGPFIQPRLGLGSAFGGGGLYGGDHPVVSIWGGTGTTSRVYLGDPLLNPTTINAYGPIWTSSSAVITGNVRAASMTVTELTPNRCVKTDASNNLISYAGDCSSGGGGGGASSLAVTTGSASGYTGAAGSSPTAVLLFDSTIFNIQPLASATAYITAPGLLTTSSATATYLSLNLGLTKSSATATYLQNSSATATYMSQNLGITGSSATATYLSLNLGLTQSSATATYLQNSSATATYLSKNLGLTQSSATATYGQLAGNNQTWSGKNTFSSSMTITGDVFISSGLHLSGSNGVNGQVLTSGGPDTVPTWTTVSGTGDNLGNGVGSYGVATTTGGFTGGVTISSLSVTGGPGVNVTYGIVGTTITISSNAYTAGCTTYAGGNLQCNSLQINGISSFTLSGVYIDATGGKITVATTNVNGINYYWPQTHSAAYLKDDGSGNLSWATPAGSGDAVKASTQTWTGGNTFISSSTFAGNVVISSGLLLGLNAGSTTQVLTSAGAGLPPYWGAGGGGGNVLASKGMVWDGSGSSLLSGTTYFIIMPDSGTLNQVYTTCVTTSPTVSTFGSIAVNVSTSAAFGFENIGSVMCASDCPSLTNSRSKIDTALTGWTTGLIKDEIIYFLIQSVTGCTYARIDMEYTKTQ
jgi:hypothetical protein